MAFLFKSKKSQDRALASRDGNAGSQGSIQSASSRMVAREEKNSPPQRATPTGSMNSGDHEIGPSSPDQTHSRRGGSVDNPSQPSDLPVSNVTPNVLLLGAAPSF